MDIRKLQRVIIDALEDVKAIDIKVFDTSHLTEQFDRVIVASGNSNRQTKALAASVAEEVKKAGGEVLSTEGLDTGEWVLVDCGDAVVHMMQPLIRQYYRLEEIWGEKPVRVKLGGGKTGLVKASGDDEDDDRDEDAEAPGSAPAKGAARKTASAKTGAKTGTKASAKTTAKSSAKPAAKSSAKSAPARKAAARPAARKTSAGTGASSPRRRTRSES